jgi:putative transposase
MTTFLSGFLHVLHSFFCSRYCLGLETMALRQRVSMLKRKNPRPRLTKGDRLFWILLRRLWPAWSNALVIVKPQTVISWHRASFRLFWRLRSRSQHPGRPKLNSEIRNLIQQMIEENPTWGAPRIHGELLKLGFDVSERTVSRYIRRLSPPDQARKLWAAFLRNHREAIAAMDFFTVPNSDLSSSVLLLYHRTRPEENPPSQCYRPSDRTVDSTATERSVFRCPSLSIRHSGWRYEVWERSRRPAEG